MVAQQINESYKYDSESIMLEQERAALIAHFWKELKERLSAKQLNVLCTYVKCGNNALQTAKTLGIYHNVINKQINNIRRIAAQLLQELNLTHAEFKEAIIPQINNYIPHTSSSVGYPYEGYMNLPANKKWQAQFGTKRYPINKSCMLPEYLQELTGGCICPICADSGNCTRTDAFPDNAENKEAIEKNIKRLEAAIECYWEEHPNEDLSGLEQLPI